MTYRLTTMCIIALLLIFQGVTLNAQTLSDDRFSVDAGYLVLDEARFPEKYLTLVDTVSCLTPFGLCARSDVRRSIRVILRAGCLQEFWNRLFSEVEVTRVLLSVEEVTSHYPALTLNCYAVVESDESYYFARSTLDCYDGEIHTWTNDSTDITEYMLRVVTEDSVANLLAYLDSAGHVFVRESTCNDPSNARMRVGGSSLSRFSFVSVTEGSGSNFFLVREVIYAHYSFEDLFHFLELYTLSWVEPLYDQVRQMLRGSRYWSDRPEVKRLFNSGDEEWVLPDTVVVSDSLSPAKGP